MINIATSGVTNIYIGTSGVTAVYSGNDLVWSIGGKDYTKDYFTVKMLGSDTIKWARTDLYYSLNGGEWTAWDSTNGLAVVEGDEVKFKGSAANSGNQIQIANSMYNVYGNIMSLYYGDNFDGQTVGVANAFARVFENSKVYDASNLCLTTTQIANQTYISLFQNCANLTYGPKVIYPMTTTGSGSYALTCLYQDCPNLVSSGELNLTRGSRINYAFERLFCNCTSLTKTPKITYQVAAGQTDANSVCSRMFEGCTSLTEIEFYTPGLATFNPTYFSRYMNVASGTFKKTAGTTWASGDNGIPSGWTVIDV